MKRISILIAALGCVPGAQAAEQAPPATPPPDAAEATAPAAESPAPRARGAQDRIELEATQITGNRELPRVLYVVPWKRADLGDAGGKPAHSLLDEVLAPVDRDVFRRQNRYYRALQPDGAAAGNSTAAEGEK